MSSYHLQLKPVSHGAGRTATAAAAYRSGELIACEATGQVHDYRRKGGVDHTQLVLPTNAPAWAALATREQIWNLAEANDRRVNSRTALEFEIALPAELDPNDRKTLALTLASEIANRHQVIADVAIHRPNNGGDQRNHHAHILITTRQLIPEGLGAKVREFSSFKDGPDTLRYWRARWADLQNDLLAARNVEARVNHRSLHDQGIDREPGRHDGPTITAIERGGRELELQGRLDPDPDDDDLAVTIERIKTASDRDLASTVDTLRPGLTPSAATRRDQLKIDYEQRNADELRARSKLRLAQIELDRYRKFHTARATLEALFGTRWDKHEQLAQDVDAARTAHAKIVDELDRTNPAAAKLRQAQAALDEYRRSHTLVALAHDKFKIESKKILALEAAVLEARIEHLKAQKALEQAKKELDTATIRADLQEPRQLWLKALDLEREFRNLQRDISRVEKEQLEANQEQQATRQPAATPPAPRPPRPRGSGRKVIVSNRPATPARASVQSQIPAAQVEVKQDDFQTKAPANQAPVRPPAQDESPRPHRPRGDGRKKGVQPTIPSVDQSAARTRAALDNPKDAVDPELAAIERLYRTRKKFEDVLDAITDRVHRQSAKDIRKGHNSLDYAMDWLKRRAPRAHQEVLAAIKGQELAAQDRALERAKPPDPDRGLGR